MKSTCKKLIALLAVLSLLLTGCSSTLTPYQANDKDNYTVSVRYDANGGIFTTNTSVIVDSYNPNELQGNELALLSPDDKARGNDAFTATKNGHFLAGWYKECKEITDSEGNVSYTYSGKWDFENDTLAIDKSKSYTSSNPVLTLYAAWVPQFEIEFYDLATGELVDELKFDPNEGCEFELPFWDEETGAIEMNSFPERSGYTFGNAYAGDDAEDSLTLLTGATVTHPGKVDYTTGTAQDPVMKLFVDYTEGEWYRIYSAEQFAESANLSGNYEILADLDFSDEIWPTSFMYGNFTGTIKGNGHSFKNIELIQTNNSKVNAGLFGFVADTAEISDTTFENVTFTVKSGTRVAGTSYGLFAGSVSADATVKDVSILKSTLQVDSSCYFGVDDYVIGLACGMGDSGIFKEADISLKAVGDNPESIRLTSNGNEVTLEFVND